MKADIHPQYFTQVHVSCLGCGFAFTTGSTKQSITVNVCSKCHPFYTGEHKFIDTKGKVDKFQKKMEQATHYKKVIAEKKAKKSEKEGKEAKSLRELLAGL
jgi:large subunit ribosomal protein L31